MNLTPLRYDLRTAQLAAIVWKSVQTTETGRTRRLDHGLPNDRLRRGPAANRAISE